MTLHAVFRYKNGLIYAMGYGAHYTFRGLLAELTKRVTNPSSITHISVHYSDRFPSSRDCAGCKRRGVT